MDRESVLKILKERLSAAQQSNLEASSRFNRMVAGVPSSVPFPDSVTRIEDAARSYRNAMRELRDAQEQMTKFLLYGVAPDDFSAGYVN